MARPIEWTEERKQEACNAIFERMAQGESCRHILDSGTENLPSRVLFIKWIAENNILGNQYACACEQRADKIFEETLNIADEMGNDIITLEDGREIENQRVIARDRLRVDTRKWFLSKLHPKKYGERSGLEITGKDGKDLIPDDQRTREEFLAKIKRATKENE